WYCPLATTAPASVAYGGVVLANAGDTELSAKLSVIPAQGVSAARTVRLPSRAQVQVRMADVVPTTPAAPYAAALVEIDGGQAAAAVGPRVRRRDLVATTVVARSGRLVASRLQVRGGAPSPGMTLDLGAPSPASSWYFPDGATGAGIVERFQLYNPSDRESEAQ